MNTLSKWLAPLALLSGTVYAQVPATNDTSDQYLNTGSGTGALHSLTPPTSCAPNLTDIYPGCFNTAAGYQTLYLNSTGYENTANGTSALLNNRTGSGNTASGFGALSYNQSGSNNTAVGSQALTGSGAVQTPATASNNTGVGAFALYSYTSGGNNTAAGYEALYSNESGSTNTAFGNAALFHNLTGGGNTASGVNALYSNTTGVENSAAGQGALYNNTSGNNNIAAGFQAGIHLTTGSYNIDVGNPGVAGESGIIRIGTSLPTPLQTATYIAGIYDNSLTGLAVVVTPSGQLGVLGKSSERFKTAIAPMGSNTEKLAQLRPVTFRYKAQPGGALQYGLIAEEVAKVYPELVIRGESGRIDGVRYDELAPILLKEVQQERQQLVVQAAEIRGLKEQQLASRAQQLSLQQQMAELQALNQATQAALKKLGAKDQLVAQR
jgi:hypothetical protein